MSNVLGFAALSFVAGGVSILTPCCLPLLPGYFSYLGGLASGSGRDRGRVLGGAALFVLGFSLVFTALGATVSVLGSFLSRHLPLLAQLAGVFVILMGLASLGVLRLPFLYRERRFDLRRIRSGPAGALPLGMAFAFGWTPCVGPVLGAILAAAGTTQTVGKGALLLFIYSLGMGIPFLALAFASTTGRSFAFLRRHGRAIERAGGFLLLGIGLLLVTGYWQQLFTPLVRYLARKGWPPI